MHKYLILLTLLAITRDTLCYQQVFYLPYSETEDVDFSVSRSDGCFQWSTDEIELVSLRPILLNFKKQCGQVLEFVVPPKTANPDKENVIKIFAENVDENIDPDTPSIFEYTFYVQPIAKLEILGLKTTIKVNDPPVPFGISAFDVNDNEFDTLDGVQIRWLIGSERDILGFNSTLNSHDTNAHLVAKASGKATLIVILEDPNYKSLEPATLELNVLSPLKVEPDGVYLLPGGEVEFKLFEEIISNGGLELKEIQVTEENPLYTFEVKDSSVVSIDKTTSLVSALKENEDETMLMVKNREGEVVKNVPIRIANADSMTINAYPTPNQVQLIDGEEYEIKVEIFDKNRRSIYPSKNILCKTSYPGQFKVKEVSENGLWAKVHTVDKGRGMVKAHLRSVLTPDDEEIEITPHLRANVNFEIYSPIKISPTETFLPWDENVKPEYFINYKVKGGSKLYTYSVDPEDMAVSEGEGQFRTSGAKLGSFTVRASMANNENIYAEAQVHILPPKSLSIQQHQSEIHFGSSIRLPVYMDTSIPEADDPIPFISCVDIPFKLNISNDEYFKFERTDDRSSARIGGSCASLFISCSKPGATTDIKVSYVVPSTNKELSVTKPFQCHKALTFVNPVVRHYYEKAIKYIAVGSTSKVVLGDGPLPWFKEPSAFYRQVEIDDPDLIDVKRVSKNEDYEENIYNVTCKSEGQASFLLIIGNKGTTDNMHPAKESREIFVNCTIPWKINLVLKGKESTNKLLIDQSSGRMLLDNQEGARLSLLVKDREGNTMDGFESLKFKVEVSDSKLFKVKSESFVFSSTNHFPEKPFIDFDAQSIKGDVDVEVSLEGYDHDYFKSRGIDMPAPLLVEEEIDEDEENFPILSDTIQLRLVPRDELLSKKP